MQTHSTDEHMILTEYGWEPGSAKQSYIEIDEQEGYEPGFSILGEINAPEDGQLIKDLIAERKKRQRAS